MLLLIVIESKIIFINFDKASEFLEVLYNLPQRISKASKNNSLDINLEGHFPVNDENKIS